MYFEHVFITDEARNYFYIKVLLPFLSLIHKIWKKGETTNYRWQQRQRYGGKTGAQMSENHLERV